MSVSSHMWELFFPYHYAENPSQPRFETRLLTLVTLQDGVGHGGEEPLALQDEDVPQAKGECERRLHTQTHIEQVSD